MAYYYIDNNLIIIIYLYIYIYINININYPIFPVKSMPVYSLKCSTMESALIAFFLFLRSALFSLATLSMISSIAFLFLCFSLSSVECRDVNGSGCSVVNYVKVKVIIKIVSY